MIPQNQLSPAKPVVEVMVNAHIEYIHARPHLRADMIETGTIVAIKHHRNLLYMLVTPDNPKLHQRWIPEEDFIAYVPTQPATPVSVAALAAAVTVVSEEDAEEVELCPDCGLPLNIGKHQIRIGVADYICETEIEYDDLGAIFNLCVQAGRRS